MSERRGRKSRGAGEPRPPQPETPWSVPVQAEAIPEAGRHFHLVASAEERDAVAKLTGVMAINRLEATFDVSPFARGGVRAIGTVSASVVQACVVTLDPVASHIEEAVDLVFMPPGGSVAPEPSTGVDEDPPEELDNGAIDLGAIAIEFLTLGIDPYPRKPDAGFDAPKAVEDSATHPFAALAALKRDSGPKQG